MLVPQVLPGQTVQVPIEPRTVSPPSDCYISGPSADTGCVCSANPGRGVATVSVPDSAPLGHYALVTPGPDPNDPPNLCGWEGEFDVVDHITPPIIVPPGCQSVA
ncbi:MAG: hypothetical protein JOZ57_15875 [Abitibacteriaceae bacterium]|nr:hypothetical protein [Abditibacteriaceae bacterium]